ncbi:hypothetical protein ENTCAN_06858 [Enterobacter cancerogenus ATCC 35316]|nr:hypothetical protein ENTCAN_06858 [Enterobacter cancerogenus ATCC 35316]
MAWCPHPGPLPKGEGEKGSTPSPAIQTIPDSVPHFLHFSAG